MQSGNWRNPTVTTANAIAMNGTMLTLKDQTWAHEALRNLYQQLYGVSSSCLIAP